MKTINKIIVHCSDTPPDRDVDAAEIRRWHVNDNGWDDIGYHYVIKRDGTIEKGRDIHIPGAHCRGHNSDSLGICLAGGWNGQFDYHGNQLLSLYRLLDSLSVVLLMPEFVVKGHRDYDRSKTCPNFNVASWWKHGGRIFGDANTAD